MTERLILRHWRTSDREPFARLNADPRVMEFMPCALSAQETDSIADRIEQHFREHGFGLCAVELRRDGAFIGFIGLNVPSFDAPFTPCVEIGWRLAAEYWGQGLATEGAHAIVHHGFDTLGLDQLVSFTVPANARSRRVMEKIGMTHDPAEDFDHPRLPAGHPLRHHVLAAPRGKELRKSIVKGTGCIGPLIDARRTAAETPKGFRVDPTVSNLKDILSS